MDLYQPNQPFHIRSFQPESDFTPLMTLLAAVEAADQSGEETTEAQQREQMTWPGFDLTKDRWVVVSSHAPNILLGYGDSWHMPGNTRADIFVAVHPEYRRRGFGSVLLQHVLVRAKQQGAATVGMYADAKLTAAQSFLEQHKFVRQSAFVELYLSGEAQQSEVRITSEYSVLPTAEQIDVQLLTQLLNASYGDRFGHKLVDEDYVQSQLVNIPNHHWFLLLSPAQTIVGLCRVRMPPTNEGSAGTSYLDAPGVIPNHRHPTLYQLLAQAGLEFLKQKQMNEIVMESWGDEPEVITAYGAFGFIIRRHSLAYEYILS